MKEAVDTLCDPNLLRSLFTLLVFEAAPAPQLYQEYKDKMEEDYRYRLEMSCADTENACLTDLASKFEGMNCG